MPGKVDKKRHGMERYFDGGRAGSSAEIAVQAEPGGGR